MKRLTARTETGHAYLVNVKPDEQEVDSPHKNTLQCILDCFERLAQYEDLEEQGLLVVLPCKVGDTVYAPFRKEVKEYKIERVDIKGICFDSEDGAWIFLKHIQDGTVFLTRAEAENAIAND